MLARYYLIPTIGRLSLCKVESVSLSHDYLAIYSAYSSLSRATTILMVRTTGIVGISTHPLNRADTFCLTLFCLHSVLPVVNCACSHKTAGRYDGAPPQNVL